MGIFSNIHSQFSHPAICIRAEKAVTLPRKFDKTYKTRIIINKTMKKYKQHFILSCIGAVTLLGITVSLTACSNAQPAAQTAEDRNADTQNPIMPIHYAGTVTHLYLTDYLPQTNAEDEVTFITEPSYEVRHAGNGELDIEGDNTLSVLSVRVNGKEQYDIPILPRLESMQGLVTVGCTDSTVQCAMRNAQLAMSEARIQWRAFWQDIYIGVDAIEFGEGDEVATIRLPKECRESNGRSFLRVYAVANGLLLNDLLVPLQDGKPVTDVGQLTRHDDQAQVLYSLMIDRFHNGNKDNDWKMNSPEVLDIVDYQGGDIKGIQQKIEEGFFDDLGITTIWISPVTQNPWDAWGMYPFPNGNKYDSTKTYTRFSGYHGYWPIYTTVIDKRFGTDEELRDMLATAHAHGINVVLDYVANHLHIESPVYKEHPTWHTDSILPDGRRNFELWDDARLTTWFDVHIPTLDLEREDVYMPMTDSALYWLANFEFDGFRHDACKHIPECYWRTLTHKMKTRYPNRHIWMIGETYGSPELINTYVKSGMLNAQFDFNVYFTAIHALCNDGKMSDIDRVVRESMATYGAHHTMGCISGNHDQVRFASLAGGGIHFWEDGKLEGWTREVGLLPNDTPEEEREGLAREAYRRALRLEMLNLTIPGVPCIYQGDEYAEVGGNDPDNRHWMRFDGLSRQEQDFREQVKKLIDIRRGNMALMYGDYIPVSSNDDTIEFLRTYMSETVRVKISRNEESSITINGNLTFVL